jgi:hypothetical protein
MITKGMTLKLMELGYSAFDIYQLTPEEANQILAKGERSHGPDPDPEIEETKVSDTEEGELTSSSSQDDGVQVQNGKPDQDDDLTQEAREIVKKLNKHPWPNDSYRPKIREYMAAVESGSVSPDLLRQMKAFAVGKGVIGH